METVIWQRTPPIRVDPTGRPIDTPSPPPETLQGCHVAPTRTEDLTSISRDGEIISWDVFCPRQTLDIERGDRVLVRGAWFTVTETPFAWRPKRRRRANHGTRFTATRQEG